MTTIWNFQKLPSYTFYGGNVVRVLALPDTDLEIRDWSQSSKPLEKGGGWGRSPKNSKKFFSALRASVWSKNKGEPGPLPWIRHFLALFFFSLSLIFTLGGREHISFSHRRYKIFMLFFQQKTTLLFLISRLLSLYLCLSLFLYSKFVDMTINRQYGYRNNFRFPFSSLFTLYLSLLHKTRVALRFPSKITWSCIWFVIPVLWVLLHWYACGADGRSGVRSRDYQNFSDE